MYRLIGISLVAAAGAVALPARPALSQQPSYGKTSVAENFREREPVQAGRIPSGTTITVRLDEDVPVDRDRFGDTFDAQVQRDVIVRGKVAIPAGSPAKVKLVESSEKANAATVRLSDVRVNGRMRNVAVSDARADTDKSGLGTAEKTAVGAAAGAIVGAVTGAGIVEGAVVGAGGGLAWGLLSDRRQEIDGGTTLRFELEEELEMR